MRHLLSNLPVDLGREGLDPALLLAEALGGAPSDFCAAALERRSLDARHKGAIRFLLALSFETERPLDGLSLPPGAQLGPAPEPCAWEVAALSRPPRVVVVGSGPAGAFCALRLLDYGVAPVVLERGPAMPERVKRVGTLWTEGRLDPEANAQFGEGGAGTFSDGKLTTRIGHPGIRYVLEAFVRFGADPRILTAAKPHVGTDCIRACMVRLRREAEARGARYRFDARLEDLKVEGGRVVAALLASGEELPCDALVLAPGHSARDTFEMLHRRGVAMKAKAFAMGVRVEHPQPLVDRAQYGPSAGHASLEAADYKLVCNLGGSRAVYSFCMCPGGHVIQCSSEPGGVVVNGMSYARRDSGYANSGIVAKVEPADFGSEHLLAGMHFQRAWEHEAFRASGERYGAPAMSVQEFMKGRASGHLPSSTFRPFLEASDLRRCLPEVVTAQLQEALPAFERKLKGFTGREALMIAIESRTSSPVQLTRGEDGQSLGLEGLYPCGEGAGYAGGITSAAVDGLRVAEWIARRGGAAPFLPFAKKGRAEAE